MNAVPVAIIMYEHLLCAWACVPPSPPPPPPPLSETSGILPLRGCENNVGQTLDGSYKSTFLLLSYCATSPFMICLPCLSRGGPYVRRCFKTALTPHAGPEVHRRLNSPGTKFVPRSNEWPRTSLHAGGVTSLMY